MPLSVYALLLAILSLVISFAIPTPLRRWARLISGLSFLAAGIIFSESSPAVSGLPELWSKRAAFGAGLVGGGILSLLVLEILTDTGPPVPMPSGSSFATEYWETRTRSVGAIVLVVLAAFAAAGVLANQISLPRAMLLAAFAGIAIVSAGMLIELLRHEPFELESSWGGLGGSLGGWRLSPSAVLLIIAVGFSIAAAAVGASEKPAEPGKKETPPATDDPAKQLASLKQDIAALTEKKDALIASVRHAGELESLAGQAATRAKEDAGRANASAASSEKSAKTLADIEAKFDAHGAMPGRVEALEAVVACLKSPKPVTPPPRSETELDEAGRIRVQEALSRRGFGPLAPDGQFGPATLAAKKRFQTSLTPVASGRRTKATATGELNPEQLTLLWTTVTAPTTPDFERCLPQTRSATDAPAPGRP